MSKKLHADTVRLLRRYHRNGYSVSDLAEAFGLSRQTVSRVVNNKTHKRVIDNTKLEPLTEIQRDTAPKTAFGEPILTTLQKTRRTRAIQERRERERRDQLAGPTPGVSVVRAEPAVVEHSPEATTALQPAPDHAVEPVEDVQDTPAPLPPVDAPCETEDDRDAHEDADTHAHAESDTVMKPVDQPPAVRHIRQDSSTTDVVLCGEGPYRRLDSSHPICPECSTFELRAKQMAKMRDRMGSV